MALQIWLPLNKNGDLSNKGLANVTVTNNGATYNASGKIGGCYKVNGTQLSIPSASYMEMKSGKLFSFACWAKGTTSSGWFIACSGWEIQFLTGHINVYPGGSSNGRDSKFNGTTAVDLWRHIAFTWDGSNLILYVDGNALNTSTFDVSYNISSNINFCYQGERYLNDVRIYDHCLSAQEVKEISKGLICHYTCDDISLHSGKLYDSSGYCNDGTVYGTLTTSSDTARNNKCINFSAGYAKNTPLHTGVEVMSMSAWVYLNGYSSSGNFHIFIGGIYMCITPAGKLSTYCYGKDPAGYHTGTGVIPLNTWTHLAIVWDPSYVYGYINAVQDFKIACTGSTSWLGESAIGRYWGNSSYTNGYISDFRLYVTALSADDIKALYQEAAFIDNKGDVSCYQLEENVSQYNMLRLALEAISKKQFNNLLVNGSSQSNGYVQLVDEGLKIYKAPNISGSLNSGGTSNWCGMVIRNTNNLLNLENNHTYIIMCDIKGHSETNLTDTGWRHSVGWNYGNSGIAPHPSNVVIYDPVVSGFNSDTYKHYSYKFTINDGVYKVATSSYLAHTEGQTYLSYNDFKIGYGYSLTGSNGTEIYINNLRMFDITSNIPTQIDINKQGLIEAFTFTENGDNAFIDSYYEMNSNQLIEI